MSKESCDKPVEHHLHLCELKAKPHNPEIDKIFENPTHVCANCGGKVNSAKNICRPKSL